MTNIRKVRNDYYKNLVKIQDARTSFFAFLGDKDGVVKADNNGNVYVLDFNGIKSVVYNSKVPLVPHRIVKIEMKKEEKRLEVIRFVDAYPEKRIPEVPNHAEAHQWPKWDTIWIRGQQILPGLFTPEEGLLLRAYAFAYYLSTDNGAWHLLPNQVIDLSAQTLDNGAKYLLLEVDESGEIQIQSSTVVDSKEVLRYEDIPVPTIGNHPLVAVKIYAGQTYLANNEYNMDVIDLRWAGYGGIAGAVEWADVLDKPSVFNPDLSITNPLYPRIFPMLVPPDATNDETEGYKIGDFWIDTIGLTSYQNIDASEDAAVWITGGGSAGGGSGDLLFRIDGSLAVTEGVWTFLITKDITIENWYIHCDDPGSSGSTIFDVNLNGTTLFSTSGDRPTLAYNDANGWAKSGTPDTINFVEGDVITIDIDQIATDAEGLNGVGQVTGSGGGASANPTIETEDGTVSVTDVGKIIVQNGTLVDNGGKEVVLKQNILQVICELYSTKATGTGVIPPDDTIPQNDEGTEFFTASITPKYETSKLKIDVIVHGTCSVVTNFTVALFQDNIPDAIAADYVAISDAHYANEIVFTHWMTAGSTGEIVFKIRAGGMASCTTTINGQNNTRLLGGTQSSSITITEVLQ